MLQAFALRLFNMLYLLPIRALRVLEHIIGHSKKSPSTRSKTLQSTQTSIRYWCIEFLFLWIDLLFISDIYETLTDLLKWTTRALTPREREVAKSVFGNAVDYRRVRIDNRARIACQRYHIIYVSFNTINSWGSFGKDLLIHELVHVWQYQKMGAVYIPKALRAQYTREGYNYGGVEKLKACLSGGGSLLDFNLEQQADILADYFRIREGMLPCWGSGRKEDLPVYEKFVDELRNTRSINRPRPRLTFIGKRIEL